MTIVVDAIVSLGKFPSSRVSETSAGKSKQRSHRPEPWKILCKLSHFVGRLKPTLGIAAK